MANSTTEQFCPNAFSDRAMITSQQALALNITYISLTPLTVIANGMVIYRIIKSRLYQTVSNFFILAMSIADFLTGAVTTPCVYILYSRYAYVRSCTFELATQFVSTTLVYFSITMVMLVAIDRLIHQKFPTRCSIILTARSARCLTLTAVVATVILSTLLTMSSLSNRIRITSLVLSLIAFFIIFVVFISYFWTYTHISKYVRNSIVWNGDAAFPGRRPARHRVPKYLRQFGTTVLLIILGICFCYFPFILLIFVAFFTKKDCLVNCTVDKQLLRLSLYVSYALIFSNSGLNAVIILLRNRNIARYEHNNRRPNAVAPGRARRCSAMTTM